MSTMGLVDDRTCLHSKTWRSVAAALIAGGGTFPPTTVLITTSTPLVTIVWLRRRIRIDNLGVSGLGELAEVNVILGSSFNRPSHGRGPSMDSSRGANVHAE